MRVTACFIILSLLVAAGPAAAQPPHADADAWRALAGALEPAAFVSVRTKDGRRVRGTLVQRTEDGIVVKPKTRLPSPMRPIAYAEIDEMERTAHGMTPGLKVVLGAGIGAGAMLLVGAVLVAMLSD